MPFTLSLLFLVPAVLHRNAVYLVRNIKAIIKLVQNSFIDQILTVNLFVEFCCCCFVIVALVVFRAKLLLIACHCEYVLYNL